MADRLRLAAARLAARLIEAASRTVEYRRGASSVTLSATLGASVLRITDGVGMRIERTDRDYIVKAADMLLDGVAVVPQRGDVIWDATDGTTKVYEVGSPPGDPLWRYSDAHGYLMRIHAKETGTV